MLFKYQKCGGEVKKRMRPDVLTDVPFVTDPK